MRKAGISDSGEVFMDLRKVQVSRLGKVRMAGAHVSIGDVLRLEKGWVAYGHGPIDRMSYHKLRRDAVDWIVGEWNSYLGRPPVLPGEPTYRDYSAERLLLNKGIQP